MGTECGCGVIGSRARLRILCLTAWGFESLHPHQQHRLQSGKISKSGLTLIIRFQAIPGTRNQQSRSMNITKEQTGELTALLKIEIGPEDYQEAIEKQIAEYKRKASIPGFRPGHVPTGLIRKMYGKAMLAEEVNKKLSDGLMNYIRDEKIDILGNPLPNLERNGAVDFDTMTSFEFYFDLGLSPVFEIPFNKDLEIENLVIRIEDEMVDKYIEETRKRFGKPVQTEPSETEAEVAEPAPADENAGENTTPDALAEKKEPEIVPAEMTPEFFEMVYPGLNLTTEADFREQVRKDAAGSFAAETDKLLYNTITESLVKNTAIELPDPFMKRWLLENNEGKYTPEEIEKNYDAFKDSMKWQLIENRIIRDHNIAVTDEDIRNYIRHYMLRQMNMGEIDEEMQKRYESIVDVFMQNKEQVQQINDQLYNGKLMELFKNTLSIVPKEVSYEEYVKTASSMHHHDHSHSYDHDHDHEHDHDHDHHHDHDHNH
jgi:trigger factor